ncbi:MAG: DUF6305 family protein [Clostridia bacterium]|nr:DUF6305 family protein [Clostridia bacterium]
MNTVAGIRRLAGSFVVALILAAVSIGPAAFAAAPAPKPPVYVTTAGRGDDFERVLAAAEAAGLKPTSSSGAICCDTLGFNSILVTFSSSPDALKAARTTERVETGRVMDLMAKAKARGVFLIGVYLGGSGGRDPFEERLLNTCWKWLTCFIATANSDSDGFIRDATGANNIPLVIIESAAELSDALRQAFGRS